jgi:hypothetical protein
MADLRMRRWCRVVAVVLLLATARGLPHLDRDDPACIGGVWLLSGHDESQHAIGASAAPVPEDHCAICHWTRSLRPPLASVAVLVARAPLTLVDRAPAVAPLTPVLENLPARAPPATLL